DPLSCITIVLPSANVNVRTSQLEPQAPNTMTSCAWPSPVTSPLPQEVSGAQVNGEPFGPPNVSGKVAFQATVVLALAMPAAARATTNATTRSTKSPFTADPPSLARPAPREALTGAILNRWRTLLKSPARFRKRLATCRARVAYFHDRTRQ